jgi:hypothetical protein
MTKEQVEDKINLLQYEFMDFMEVGNYRFAQSTLDTLKLYTEYKQLLLLKEISINIKVKKDADQLSTQ